MEDKEIFVPPVIKKFEEQDESMFEYFEHKRHVFIFTQAGKPIYIRYGDELKLASYIASISTIMQKLLLPKTEGGGQNFCRMIENEKTKTVVLFRENIVLMIVTRDKNDPYLFLVNILDHINIQMVSIITNMLNSMLEKRPSFDPRTMLGGTQNNMGVCIKNAIKSPGIFLHSFMCHPLNNNARSQVSSIMKDHLHSDTSYMLLLSPFGIFNLVKQKKAEVKPDDILLIMNLLHSSQALRASESWVPVCLPGISPEGFVYAYIYFYTKNIGVVMITDVTTSDMFFELKEKGKNIFDSLVQNKLLDKLNDSLLNLPYSEDAPGIKNIRHYMIKQVDSFQYTMPKYRPYAEMDKKAKRYNQIWCGLYDIYLECQSKKKEFYHIEQTNEAYYVIATNGEHIIFMDYNQFETVDNLHLALKELFKWIKNEESFYFIKI